MPGGEQRVPPDKPGRAGPLTEGFQGLARTSELPEPSSSDRAASSKNERPACVMTAVTESETALLVCCLDIATTTAVEMAGAPGCGWESVVTDCACATAAMGWPFLVAPDCLPDASDFPGPAFQTWSVPRIQPLASAPNQKKEPLVPGVAYELSPQASDVVTWPELHISDLAIWQVLLTLCPTSDEEQLAPDYAHRGEPPVTGSTYEQGSMADEGALWFGSRVLAPAYWHK